MFKAICYALGRLSEGYPPRWWWPLLRVYGQDGKYRTCYLTRVSLTPRTPWGQLRLHVFHRSDLDRDPHDHVQPFWTIPINQSYWEEVFEHNAGRGCMRMVLVPAWRINYRPSAYTHRIVRTETGRWPLVTVLWIGRRERDWGFWCHGYEPLERMRRHFVPWKQYVYDGVDANIDGIDDVCPGTVSGVLTNEGVNRT